MHDGVGDLGDASDATLDDVGRAGHAVDPAQFTYSLKFVKYP